MKKRWILLLIILVPATAAIWGVLGPTVTPPPKKYFYVHTGSRPEAVRDSLLSRGIISNGFWFSLISYVVRYDRKIYPGKYDISGCKNILALVRKLRSGKQTPIRLTITKLRTRNDLAGRLGRYLEADSADVAAYLNSNDSLASMELDTNTVLSIIIPNTYMYFWNNDYRKVLANLQRHQKSFWNESRRQKAATLGLSPLEVYTLASIVEEETNKASDKGLIASVYLNRLRAGMKLQADPTVRFAFGDFSIRRVTGTHLAIASPYNTYQNKGLPPGPICTPSIFTIDAVLDAPETRYLYFAASADFSGSSEFSGSYSEHLQHARKYRKALDTLLGNRKNIR